MHMANKKIYSLVLITLLVLLNIVFRVPTTPYELGRDSLLIHQLTNALSSEGTAGWILHPLSFFGLYPASTPSGVIFWLSGLSQISNIEISYMILFMAIVVGLVGLFTSMLMAKEIQNNIFFIFFVSLLFSLSPLFLRFTIWTTSTRHLFMALTPLLLWCLFRIYSQKTNKAKHVLLLCIIGVLIVSLHHMALLLPAVLVAFGVAIFLELAKNYHRKIQDGGGIHDVSDGKNRRLKRGLLPMFAWIIIFIMFLLPQLYQWGFYETFKIWFKYQSGFFWYGTTPEIIFLNMSMDYASRISILSIFAIIGLAYLFIKPEKKVSENSILILLLLMAPIFTLGLYVTSFLLPVFCLLIGLGLIWSLEHRSIQKMAPYISGTFVLLTVVFSLFMMFHWGAMGVADNQMDHATHNTGLFMKEYSKKTDVSMSNSGRDIGRRVSTVSYAPFYEDRAYILDLTYGMENKSNFNIEWSGLSGLIASANTLYIETNVSSVRNYLNIMRNDVNDKNTKELLERYNIRYVVEKVKISGMIEGYAMKLYDSKFMKSLPDSKNVIYDNGELHVWHLNTTL